MSAWIVSKKHIDLLVKAFKEGTRDTGLDEDFCDLAPNALGQMLVTECVASVSYRYPNDKPGEWPGPCDPYYLQPYEYEDPEYLPTAAELAKAINCYEYQTCEHPAWKECQAHQLCTQALEFIGAVVPISKRLNAPGLRWREYDDAPWGFDVEEIEACKAKAKGKA